MLAPLFNLDLLKEPLTRGDLILTANNRLRNHMLRAYAAQQTATVWQPPAIQPLNHWLDECWRTLQDSALPQAARLIASTLQRQLLWEDIILTSEAGSALLQAEELAQSADAALRNLQLWQLGAEHLKNEDNLNTRCFVDWLVQFDDALLKRELITAESAYEIVLQAFVDGHLPHRGRLYLHGFDDLPPLYRQLLTCACDELIELPIAPAANHTLVRTQTSTDDAEIRAAALWSHQQLQQNSRAMIGIIVPNLGQSRTQVERIFTEVFEPLAALPQTSRYTLPFNFSAGTPLATTPLIQTALNLLNLNRKQWELEPLCALLQSPFFGNADTEVVVRNTLCTRLRKLGQFTISASELRYHSQKVCARFNQPDEPQSERLDARLLSLENDRRAIAGNHSASYWVALFQQQLQRLGWPGTRRLDSQEYQQMSLWQKLLEEFCALDGGNFYVDFSQALKHLRKLANSTPFQAQTPDSPIQILGVLEGAGLQFSHCWVMGLHHRQWPPVPAPNPLLPIQLQRQHNMPHASAERELLFARALTDNYRRCADHIIFSCAHSDGDNELRPSALIRDLPLTPLTDVITQELNTSHSHYQQIVKSRQLELLHCAKGPELSQAEMSPRGGSRLFTLQASCPFSAFAILRLGAASITPPTLGFSAMERGTLLHNVLAIVWRALGNSHALQTMNSENLAALLKHAITTEIKSLQQQRPRELGNVYCQLEEERLFNLLTLWLNEEKNRPAFTVAAIEEAYDIQFCGLTLTTRIDRIDQLIDANHLNAHESDSHTSAPRLLVDYKTSSPKLSAWLGERPDDPQLPLYAVSQPNDIAAIAFAQINAKAMAWLGWGELPVQHPGISAPPQPWSQQLAEWQQALSQLAYSFITGDARVDFKHSTAQQYADDLRPLNRIAEINTIAELLNTDEFVRVGGNH